MSLAVARDGSLYVLDQVHGRVLHRRRDGSYAPPIVVGDVAVQDLRADAHGLALLDRMRDHSVHLVEGDKHARNVSLTTLGVVDPGGTTGLFVDDNDALYVEESLAGEARRVTRPLDGGPALPGRPSRDRSQLLNASMSRGASGFVVRGLALDGSQRFQTVLTIGAQLFAIVLLDSDTAGNVYAAAVSAKPVPGSRDFSDETLDVFQLTPDGVQEGHLSLPHPPSAYTSFRELEVADVGLVWWMHAAPDGDGVVVDELTF
jgi:hypothetical protein